ncbi:hypothetical protein BHM03_00021140 [Ensete ventricosum]|nr:hypothetical protein BHM03_00021140 [Ensete ventricosum]
MRGRPAGGDDVRARTALGFLLFLYFFFPFSPSIDHRRPKSTADSRFLPQSAADGQNRSLTINFGRYRPVASDPHTSNLADRYVPPVPGGTSRNCKPWF